MTQIQMYARVAKLVDAQDLKSWDPYRSCQFKSGPGHQTKTPSQQAWLFCWRPGKLDASVFRSFRSQGSLLGGGLGDELFYFGDQLVDLTL